MTETINPYFDPDEVKLTKDHIRLIINAVIKRWKKNKSANMIQIKALEAFRVSLRLQSDENIEEIFKAIIVCVNEMQMMNAMLRMKEERPTTDQLLAIVQKRIERGDIF